MRIVALAAVLIALTMTAMTPASAQRRCPAGDSGCTLDNAPDRIRERVDQGRREVEDAKTVRERVDAVKNTVKDCMNCGMDAIKSGTSNKK